jgi:hypothetical protein
MRLAFIGTAAHAVTTVCVDDFGTLTEVGTAFVLEACATLRCAAATVEVSRETLTHVMR